MATEAPSYGILQMYSSHFSQAGISCEAFWQRNNDVKVTCRSQPVPGSQLAWTCEIAAGARKKSSKDWCGVGAPFSP